MKSLEEFTQAGAELYLGIQRAELQGAVDDRALKYYSLHRRTTGIKEEYFVTGEFTDEQKPELLEHTLNEFVGGFAYALWQKDPSIAKPQELPLQVDLLTKAVKVKYTQVTASVRMDSALQALDLFGSRVTADKREAAFQAVMAEDNFRLAKASLSRKFNEYVELQKVGQ
jgi:hypothetical protein